LPDLSKRDKLLYHTINNIDLTIAHTDKRYELPGSFDTLAVEKLTGDLSIKLNYIEAGSIDLTKHKTISLKPYGKFDCFYYTNTAQSGAAVILQVGGDTSFEVSVTDPQKDIIVGLQTGQASTAAWADMLTAQYIGDAEKLTVFLTETGGVNGVTFRISASMLGVVYQVLNAGIPVAANGSGYAVLSDHWRYLKIEVIDTIAASHGTANAGIYKLRA